jgi:hypothetical protein
MLVFCETVLDRYVAAVDIAGFTQATIGAAELGRDLTAWLQDAERLSSYPE